MGQLDDAIREHLDLKRRRGADPDEVARAEHEALGPVRREPVHADATGEPQQHASEPAASQAEPAAEQHQPAPELTASDTTRVLAPEDRHEPPHGDPLHEHQEAHEAPAELGGAAAQPPAGEPEPADADRAGDAGESISAAPPAESIAPAAGPARSSADPAQERPEQHQAPGDPRHSDIVHQPTTEFHVEDHDDHDEDKPAAAQKPAPDEDVLEETPDFLQETPEHDRLWFEQRPPRDFDFDG